MWRKKGELKEKNKHKKLVGSKYEKVSEDAQNKEVCCNKLEK